MHPAVEPEISILIPTYNGARWIAETLKRLPDAAGGATLETIVADNASTDGTAAICGRVAGVRVLADTANRGFSQAVNRAARAARGRTLVAINQDLHLQPGALAAVRDFLSSRKAVVGGRLSSSDGAPQPSCGPFPTLAGTLARLTLPRAKRKYYLGDPPDQARAVDWVTGAFIAFDRDVFDRTGGFDEDYFMYYEDVDFCLRARAAGFPAYFLPAARALHLSPFSERGDAPEWLRKEVRRSQMTYFRKHRPAWEYGAVRALNRAYFAARGWPWR